MREPTDDTWSDPGWTLQFQEQLVAVLLREPERLAPFRAVLAPLWNGGAKGQVYAPLAPIARAFLHEWERSGVAPSLATFGEDIREVARRHKPAQAEAIRQEFAKLQRLDIHDAAAVARRALGWAKYVRHDALLLQFAEALDAARTTGRDFDAAPYLAALQEIEQLGAEGASGAGPVLVTLADVEVEPIRWLWRGRIPRGMLTLVAGDPDVGKSNLLLDIAARITRRSTVWPDGGLVPYGQVLVLTAEDHLASTVLPRFQAMGGDTARITALTAVRDAGGAEGRVLSLATDLGHLEKALQQRPGTVLCVIDTLSCYFGEGDPWQTTKVRRVLAPVAALAERTGVAIVGITHFNKGTNRKALYRILDSIGFVGAARAAFAVARDPDDKERRLLLPIKANLARTPPGLAFRLETVEVGGGIEVSRVAWEPGTVALDAEAALGPPASAEEKHAHDEAVDFLRTVLGNGPLPHQEVKAQAKQAGLDFEAVQRAKGRLKVEARREGFGPGGRWVWRLPRAGS